MQRWVEYNLSAESTLIVLRALRDYLKWKGVDPPSPINSYFETFPPVNANPCLVLRKLLGERERVITDFKSLVEYRRKLEEIVKRINVKPTRIESHMSSWYANLLGITHGKIKLILLTSRNHTIKEIESYIWNISKEPNVETEVLLFEEDRGRVERIALALGYTSIEINGLRVGLKPEDILKITPLERNTTLRIPSLVVSDLDEYFVLPVEGLKFQQLSLVVLYFKSKIDMFEP